MRKVRIYKAVDGVDINKFAESGWDIMPPTIGYILFKELRLRKNSAAVKAIKMAYEKYAHTFPPMMLDYLKELGIEFIEATNAATGEKQLMLSNDEKCWDALCTWRVEIDMGDDGWIRLHPLDIAFPNPLYPADLIDKYAKDIIDEEIKRGTIEEFEASELIGDEVKEEREKQSNYA